MLENFENMTERRAKFRNYHVLLQSSSNLLLLLYLMHWEHTFYFFVRLQEDKSFFVYRVFWTSLKAPARGIGQVCGWGTCVARSFVWPRYVTNMLFYSWFPKFRKNPNVWTLVFHQWASVSNATQSEPAQYSLKTLRFYDSLSSLITPRIHSVVHDIYVWL